MTYYAAEGRIGTAPIDGGIEITREQYKAALDGIAKGKMIVVEGGFAVIDPPPPEPQPDPEFEPARRWVLKSVIIERLHAAGKLEAAKTALDADLYKRERWYAPDKPAIYADDAEAIALLTAIGADPDVILAE